MRKMNSASTLEAEKKAVEPKLRHQPPHHRIWETTLEVSRGKTTLIAALAVAGILLHLLLRFGFRTSMATAQLPLLMTLVLGGVPLVYELLKKLLRRDLGSDLLAGISIITSILLGEYMPGSIVVLMFLCGESVENYILLCFGSVC